MRHLLLSLLFISSLSSADDYSFDMESIETRSYDFSGYLCAEYKYQNLNKDSELYTLSQKENGTQHTFFNEALFRFNYYKDDFKLNSAFSARYDSIDGEKEHLFTAYQFYIHYRANINHSVDIGKKTPKWGKGYFFNPAAFLDRPKDPTQPENAYEGYSMFAYNYNKSFVGDLKNLKLDLIYMPTGSNINEDYFDKKSYNLALKLYLLYLDTDIDFIYVFNNELKNKFGFTFSKNLATYFEIHGEYAKERNGFYVYLLGLKYVTAADITITSEYYYHSEGLNEEQIAATAKMAPFSGKQYLVNKFSKKEPFNIVYSSIYFRDMLNLEDFSHMDSLGFVYTFKNDLEVDFSYNLNTGNGQSEFGKKMVSSFAWLKATWYF
ncbi:MAG: hypothetical protein ABXS92_06955 [Sulfurimonas sp.]